MTADQTTIRTRRRSFVTTPRDLIAIIGADGEVIALGWPSGDEGGMRPLMVEEAHKLRAYLDRFLKAPR